MHGLRSRATRRHVGLGGVAASRYDYSATRSARTPPPTRCPAPTAAAPARWPTAAAPAGRRWREGHLATARAPTARTSSSSACSRTVTSCATGPRTSPATGSAATRPGSLASDVRGETRLRVSGRRTLWPSRPSGARCSAAAPNAGHAERRLTAFSATQRPDAIADRAASPTSRPRPRSPSSGARTVLKGLGRPGGAHADGGRALRRDLDDQLAVHQRSEPASPSDRGPANSAPRTNSPGQRLARLTFFAERHRAMRSIRRRSFDDVANRNISRGAEHRAASAPRGIEVAYNGSDIWIAGSTWTGA